MVLADTKHCIIIGWKKLNISLASQPKKYIALCKKVHTGFQEPLFYVTAHHVSYQIS